LLEYVLSNIELKDKKLSYIQNDPYKTMIEENKKAQNDPNNFNWCRIADLFLTINPGNVDNYKLKELVCQFNLSGELLSN